VVLGNDGQEDENGATKMQRLTLISTEFVERMVVVVEVERLWD
jgi:hypothetical protein